MRGRTKMNELLVDMSIHISSPYQQRTNSKIKRYMSKYNEGRKLYGVMVKKKSFIFKGKEN
jgi:hypothetical protein